MSDTPEGADQDSVLRFLGDPSAYGTEVQEVARIDTHGAIVFLAGDFAYKIKRALRYPYMDFSTLEKRQQACARELSLNARTAPSLYLKVIAVTRGEDGCLALDGGGTTVEWVLVMKRFPQEDLLSNQADRRQLTRETMVELAEVVAEFHDTAPPPPGATEAGNPAGTETFDWVVRENIEELTDRRDLFPAGDVARLAELSLAQLAGRKSLLDARASAGQVRLCHGDLHLRNVVLLDGHPRLFDAIEFNDAIACIDVFYDLAFLLMDLEHRGLRPFANLVLNRYLQHREALDALPLLPLFLSARACVRAKVAASLEKLAGKPAQKTKRRAEAQNYFSEALAFLTPPPPRLVAVGGLSGSGKTTVASHLAPRLGAAPGAVHLRSDILRKALAGVGEETRLPPEAYNPKANRAVYDDLLRKAANVLAAGHAVIVDAVFARPEERAALERVARASGCTFSGLWLEARPANLRSRVEGRRHDASDATAKVVDRQLDYDLGRLTWTTIDADGTVESVVETADRHLAL
ncbi:AAA family ATPase [Pelagibius sp.]|uniref:bifunctional aminoglycoside phosphotransferase/ATP-binding protein n=1 Tax=Pelagibius sp. TaxID=1931238 RepID=UPI003BB0CDDF